MTLTSATFPRVIVSTRSPTLSARAGSGLRAPALQQEDVAPAPLALAQALPPADHAEAAGLEHGHARLVLGEDHRLDGPDAARLGARHQGVEQRLADPAAARALADVHRGLGHAPVDLADRDPRQRGPPDHLAAGAGDEAMVVEMVAVPALPRGDLGLEGRGPGPDALGVDRGDARPVAG